MFVYLSKDTNFIKKQRIRNGLRSMIELNGSQFSKAVFTQASSLGDFARGFRQEISLRDFKAMVGTYLGLNIEVA